jgi:hypothetical protein
MHGIENITVEQHGYRANIQVPVIYPFNGLITLFMFGIAPLNPMHGIENIFMLNAYINSDFLSQRLQRRIHALYAAVLDFRQHNHGEKLVLHYGLRNILDIRAVLEQRSGYLCDYAFFIFSYYGYNCFH